MKKKKLYLFGFLLSVFALGINSTQKINSSTLSDDFEAAGELTGFVTNNANALPDVIKVDGRYRAELTDNQNNVTLHFNENQGRLDAKLLTFPFEFIARNIGIGTLEDSQTAPSHIGNEYVFSGVQVHVLDFDDPTSSHVVVGHRGPTGFTIEGKNTVNGSSSVNDAGANIVPNGRADIRIVGGEDNSITVYWQLPNPNVSETPDDWTLYNDTGQLPGTDPVFGDSVYVGLITYAFELNGLPFVGTSDAIEVTSDISTSNEPDLEPEVQSFLLHQNYPNPFNPATTITFELEQSGFVKLEVFDVSGQRISVLKEGTMNRGRHDIHFNATGLSSGVYYYRLTINGREQTRQMTLLK